MALKLNLFVAIVKCINLYFLGANFILNLLAYSRHFLYVLFKISQLASVKSLYIKMFKSSVKPILNRPNTKSRYTLKSSELYSINRISNSREPYRTPALT